MLLILTAPALYAADVKETIHVVITGGANAGTYDGSTDRGGCSAGLTGKGSWGNQYSLVKENNPKVLGISFCGIGARCISSLRARPLSWRT